MLDSFEQVWGANISHVGCQRFRYFIFDNALKDISATGVKFTWHRRGLFQRLDRALYNFEWESFAPGCSVRNLHWLKLDHRPLFISLQSSQYRGDRPFQCLASWMYHKDFGSSVKSNWLPGRSVLEKLEGFKEVVTTRNKQVYGNIFEKKRKLIAELKKIQKVLEFQTTQSLQ